MPYSHLLFDLDGTIVDSRRLQYEALEALFRQFSLPFDRSVADAFFQLNIHYWALYEAGEIDKAALRLGRFTDLGRRLGLSGAAAEALARQYPVTARRFAPVYDGAHAVLARLRETASLSLITNGFTDIQLDKIARAGLEPYFDHVFIGEALGFMKPDRRFFAHVHRAIGLPDRGDCLVIGDSLGADIRGGADFGFPTCWINPEGLPNDTDVVPGRTLPDLRGLLRIQKD